MTEPTETERLAATSGALSAPELYARLQALLPHTHPHHLYSLTLGEVVAAARLQALQPHAPDHYLYRLTLTEVADTARRGAVFALRDSGMTAPPELPPPPDELGDLPF